MQPRRLTALNPATGEVVGEYPAHSPASAAARLEAARQAQLAWRREPFSARAPVLRKAAERLQARRDELARLMALEMGKPVRQGLFEVNRCALACAYFAEHAEELLQDEAATCEARQAYVTYQPLGVVLAVMPWNFPLYQVFRCSAPALMAGDAVVLKHASNVPGCSLAIDSIFQEAGAPAGLFQSLLLPAADVPALIQHPAVAAVSFTGSTAAGRSVARVAGEALKPCTLELGGSDAYVILEDADVSAAAEIGAAARLINSGQSCIAAKRFVVVRPRLKEFQEALVTALGKRKLGDPLQEETDIGPLARLDLRDELHAQVQRSLSAGARLRLGGYVPEDRGAYYPASLLVDVPPGCAARTEELFGPVAVVIAVADEAEAVAVANETSYGLGAAVFTSDPNRGGRLARNELEAGACFVNASVRSDPRLPFGGVKQSGFGREMGAAGIRSLCNVKMVWIA